MDTALKNWLDAYEFLPENLRTDAKRALLSTMCYVLYSDSDLPVYSEEIPEGVIREYLFDRLLRFLGECGYVLTKSAKRLEFHDLERSMAAFEANDSEGCVPPMAPALKSWRESYRFLPEFLMDFSNRKAAFRYFHSRWLPEHPLSNDAEVNVVQGITYAMDAFLWLMARHGLVIKKSRKALPFRDLHEEVAVFQRQQGEQLSKIIHG